MRTSAVEWRGIKNENATKAEEMAKVSNYLLLE